MDKGPITTNKHLHHLNNSFSLFASWVSKSFGFCHKNHRPLKEGGAISWRCAVFRGMEELGSGRDDGSCELFSECRESSSSCEASSSSEEKQSCDGTEESSLSKEETAQVEDGKIDKSRSNFSDIELMKERFVKLLLGEDMSGCGKGVCSALAISNAITNLCATLFGQLLRLEPLLPEKKAMWQRDMEWLLCVSDHIVEMVPSWQTFPDGRKLEVMTCRPRTDLYINLPALRKLDHMLIEILDSFCDQEFWYADHGIEAADSDSSSSLGKPLQRQEEKWWLPVPRVPPGGLQENSRKLLQHKRKCTNQILKAAMAINSNALAEMDVPVSYLDSLPKNGRESLGDVMHRYITSDQFSVECLLDCLEFSSEHQALEIANRLEASVYMWRQKAATRPKSSTARSNPKSSSLGAVKERVIDAEKRELFAERAESLLICLKQRFPGLTQTTLDMSKIQFNKDIGKSILESYSRALESLAFNIVARIDDVLYVDGLTKNSDQFSSISHEMVAAPCSVPSLSTLDAITRSNASFSPSPLIRPVPGERSPFFSRKAHGSSSGVKKVLTDSSTGELKASNNSNIMEVSAPVLVKSHEDMTP